METEIEVAVLFADVVGSTELYEKLGDLKARDTIAECLAVMKDATQKNHGTVIKTIGDRLVFAGGRELDPVAHGAGLRRAGFGTRPG